MWYNSTGKMADVAVSSRVRLARNIKSLPFCIKMNNDAAQEAIRVCAAAVPPGIFKNIPLSELSDIEKLLYAERHLISFEMIKSTLPRSFILSEDHKISIMINEEDHIRIQSMEAGLELEKAYDSADRADDLLNETIEYGFDEQLGYLTSCPSNVGTGMRASVMLHLPATVATGNIEKLIRVIAMLGMTVRGIYGEGSKAYGNIFQVSNQVKLGISEREILEKLSDTVNDIISKERAAREAWFLTDKIGVTDRVKRSMGILKYAHTLRSNECMNLLSDVSLGINLAIITDVSHDVIAKIRDAVMPAALMTKYNTEATAAECDLMRAAEVQKLI